jgi:Glyoxalase superfamily protein
VSESLVPIFRIDTAVDVLPWYRRLGFSLVSEHTFGPGMPKYLILERNGVHVHLSEHEGDAPPNGVAFMWVSDIASIAAEFQTHTHNEPWGQELELVDPAGNRLRICQPSAQ